MVSINSYNYLNLIIGYGPKKEVLCNIFWSSQKCHFNIIFLGGITAINAHSVMRDEFVNHLNFHQNLSEIVQLLQETYNPLSSVVKLSNTPHLGTPVSVKFNYIITYTCKFFSISYNFIVWKDSFL